VVIFDDTTPCHLQRHFYIYMYIYISPSTTSPCRLQWHRLVATPCYHTSLTSTHDAPRVDQWVSWLYSTLQVCLRKVGRHVTRTISHVQTRALLPQPPSIRAYLRVQTQKHTNAHTLREEVLSVLFQSYLIAVVSDLCTAHSVSCIATSYTRGERHIDICSFYFHTQRYYSLKTKNVSVMILLYSRSAYFVNFFVLIPSASALDLSICIRLHCILTLTPMHMYIHTFTRRETCLCYMCKTNTFR